VDLVIKAALAPQERQSLLEVPAQVAQDESHLHEPASGIGTYPVTQAQVEGAAPVNAAFTLHDRQAEAAEDGWQVAHEGWQATQLDASGKA
jgi:hypothetical protein